MFLRGSLVGSVLVLCIALFTSLVLYNTATVKSNQINVSGSAPTSHPKFSQAELAHRLAGGIRIPTISFDNQPTDEVQFLALHKYLEELFPLVHTEMVPYKLGELGLTLLFEWRGSLYGTPEDKPIILNSHLDVVPIPEGTYEKWSVDPFSGLVDETFIWGRGTIDDKQGVFAIFEASEWLLSVGHKPTNTIYLGFGHDEEIGGHKGAKFIGEWFKERNIELEFLVDEGMTIYKDSPLPLPATAIIGVAEKGMAVVDLTVNHKGGHASLSTGETAIDILSKAVTKVHSSPMPTQFGVDAPFRLALEAMGAETDSLIMKAITANMWLFHPLLSKLFEFDSLAVVNVRTTSATTMVSGGTKVNVLPTRATATINHRIVPGDSLQSVIQHDIDAINDPRVNVTLREGLEPSFVSSQTSLGYKILSTSIRETFSDVPVVPSLFVANTDTRHYWGIAKDIYRFCPTIMTPSDLPRFHGIDERIGISNYFQIIQFYHQLIKNYHL